MIDVCHDQVPELSDPEKTVKQSRRVCAPGKGQGRNPRRQPGFDLRRQLFQGPFSVVPRRGWVRTRRVLAVGPGTHCAELRVAEEARALSESERRGGENAEEDWWR